MSKYTFTESNYDSICKQAFYGCLWGYEIDKSIFFANNLCFTCICSKFCSTSRAPISEVHPKS